MHRTSKAIVECDRKGNDLDKSYYSKKAGDLKTFNTYN